jgi:hypothetical protein
MRDEVGGLSPVFRTFLNIFVFEPQKWSKRAVLGCFVFKIQVIVSSSLFPLLKANGSLLTSIRLKLSAFYDMLLVSGGR